MNLNLRILMFNYKINKNCFNNKTLLLNDVIIRKNQH